MSIDTLLAVVQRLQMSAEALAVIGAELRARREGLQLDRSVEARMSDVLKAIDPDLLEGLSPDQEETSLVMIQAAMMQAVDMLSDPARSPGWTHVNPAILQGQGLGSRRYVRAIGALAAQRPDLHEMLNKPGSFLDVGTGVGWLAIEAARQWPALRCVGIDVWEPALRIARANLAGTGMEDRIELRTQAVECMDESAVYSLAWLPPFIPVSMMPIAFENIFRSLKNGGWVVVSTLGAMPDPLSQALAALKLARIGTHSWTPNEIETELRRYLFDDVEIFEHTPTTTIIVGRKALANAVAPQ